MDALDDRILVLKAVVFFCCGLGVLAGFPAAAATLALVAVVVQLTHWIGMAITGLDQHDPAH